jgi:hypothetical protein
LVFNGRMSLETLIPLIDRLGQTGLARRICTKVPSFRVRQGHVRKWLKSSNPELMPPSDYLPALEAIASDLGMHITARDLRPDIYPPPSPSP